MTEEVSKETTWRPPRLEKATPEGEKIVEIVSAEIDRAADELGLESYHTPQEIKRYKEIAIQIATDLELDKEYFNDCRRNAVLLGVAAEWERAGDFRKKKELLSTVHAAAEDSAKGAFLGAKVRRIKSRLSSMHKNGGLAEEVSMESKTSTQMLRSEMYLFVDKDETKEAAVAMGWDPSSPFSGVRERLGIDQGSEKLASIYVLRLSGDEMARRYGLRGVAFGDVGPSGKVEHTNILLPSDCPRGVMQHEYAHSQSGGLAFGKGFKLFMGLEEAVTESLVDTGEMRGYGRQRAVCTSAERVVTGFSQYVRQAYKTGDGEDITALLQSAISGVGLRGALALIRMDYRVSSEERTNVALLDPLEVLDALSEGVSRK
jgi:hypothetical protein